MAARAHTIFSAKSVLSSPALLGMARSMLTSGNNSEMTASLGISRATSKKTEKLNYKVCLTTKATPAIKNSLLVIEPEDYTAAEVQALKKGR